MDSDPIEGIVRRLAWMLVGAAAMEAAEERMSGFGSRFPGTLRLARIVGGALLVLVGLLESVLAVVVFADVVSGEGLAGLYLLIPLAFGVGLTVWGLGTMRRGWATGGVAGAADTDSHLSAAGGLIAESYDVGAPTARWLRTVFVFVLWISGSVIAILAGVPDGHAMLLGWLLPITAYVLHRRRRAAGRY